MSLAFEALSSNYEALVWNVRENGLESAVRTLPIALEAERKRVKIQIEGDDPARTGTANILPARFKFKEIDLEIHPLDDLWRDGLIHDDVNLMKIDTDGYDLEILRGARRLLAQQRPACHVELNLHCLGWHNQTVEKRPEVCRGNQLPVALPNGIQLGEIRSLSPRDALFRQRAAPANRKTRALFSYHPFDRDDGDACV